MGGYTKLHSSIVLSTVWREPNHIRIVWITMMALADARGYVGASIPGLADAARVSIPECEEALGKFTAPDPYSRSKEHEGRRIEEADGGWFLLNYQAHRDGRDPERRREQNREAQTRWREKHKPKVSQCKPGVSRCKPTSAQAEAEAEAEAEEEKKNPPTPLAGGETDLVGQVFRYWMTKRAKRRSKLTAQRRRKIEARLREGYTEQDLRDAIDGIAFSKHHRGENEEGKVWDDLTLICRDGSHVEMLRDMPRTTGSPAKDDVATAADFSDQAMYGRRLQN